MTYEELDGYIDKYCRDSRGVLNTDAMYLAIATLGSALTPEERVLIGFRLLYKPAKRGDL